MAKASTSTAKTEEAVVAKSAASKPATKKAATKKSASTTRATTKARASTKTATKSTAAKTGAATKKAATKPAAKKATKKKAATKKTPAKAASAKAATKKQAAPSAADEKTNAKKSSLKNALKAAAAKQKKKVEPEPEEISEEDKPKIAPAPMRPALRVAKRAEARRDKNQTFKVKTQIIYPAHGVGYIREIEKTDIAGIDVELFVIDFEHEKMKLRVPVAKAATAGMRNLSTSDQMVEALDLVEGKARVKRTMWSRRAQEYEAKINSGDLTSVAEVVRDLFRADDQPEQSYSERQLFEQARERLGRELAALRNCTLEEAIAEIHKHLDLKERP